MGIAFVDMLVINILAIGLPAAYVPIAICRLSISIIRPTLAVLIIKIVRWVQ